MACQDPINNYGNFIYHYASTGAAATSENAPLSAPRRKNKEIGIAASGLVINIHPVGHYKGPTTDRVHVRYNSIIPGRCHETNFLTTYGRYRIGQTVPVKYIPEQPDKIVVALTRGCWLLLNFTTLLFLFVLFAIYKIDEMVKGNSY
ncbi:hypothetical protein U0035_18925 [Niabella yanshanensis]|uniref:DUF3592 domain-containing protein n=1 Tax=Niabella yanshanensis TaxID=577386 RepID=A0ABZ0W4V3_9BACT|nr:hypothetical protein [Niabella yanshanensis]WQD37744.1 hypothetical protein U0035_18925 [Niabella yanshanensis]